MVQTTRRPISKLKKKISFSGSLLFTWHHFPPSRNNRTTPRTLSVCLLSSFLWLLVMMMPLLRPHLFHLQLHCQHMGLEYRTGNWGVMSNCAYGCKSVLVCILPSPSLHPPLPLLPGRGTFITGNVRTAGQEFGWKFVEFRGGLHQPGVMHNITLHRL